MQYSCVQACSKDQIRACKWKIYIFSLINCKRMHLWQAVQNVIILSLVESRTLWGEPEHTMHLARVAHHGSSKGLPPTKASLAVC